MQVLSNEFVDDDTDLETLTEKEFRQRRRNRRQIRLKYPGVAAIHFEILLDILLEDVVGWSIRKDESTGVPGLFGMCKALVFAVEEQGRKTLHVHMTIWIDQYKKLQRDMFFGSWLEKRHAESTVQTYYCLLYTSPSPRDS